jgi:integrase
VRAAGVATLRVPVSKTEAGKRTVHLEPELVTLLREHKLASRWSQPDDFVFPGRHRDRSRERNSVRTRVLHTSVAHTNEALEAEGRHRSPSASASTPCAAPTQLCAPSSASIPRSPRRRWATPTRA